MPSTRLILAAALILVLAGTLGCSDSDKFLSDDDFTEQQLQLLMRQFAFVLESIHPFGPAPLTGESGVGECLEVKQDVCETGVVRECPVAKDGSIDVLIEDCVNTDEDGDELTINGTLTYFPGQDWPEGSRVGVIRPIGVPEIITLQMAFDGTPTVFIVVDDQLNDIQTNCFGNLVDPFEVVC